MVLFPLTLAWHCVTGCSWKFVVFKYYCCTCCPPVARSHIERPSQVTNKKAVCVLLCIAVCVFLARCLSCMLPLSFEWWIWCRAPLQVIIVVIKYKYFKHKTIMHNNILIHFVFKGFHYCLQLELSSLDKKLRMNDWFIVFLLLNLFS